MKTTNGNKAITKQAIKREDIARRKARKEARGKQWQMASVL